MLRWIEIEEDADKSNLEEMLHYADPANGGVHAIVPGELLCFPTPADLPDGRDWMDTDQPHGGRDGGKTRLVSSSFLADLLAELGVSAAVCLHDGPYDRSAFARCGIALEDLRLDPARPHLLPALDRLLSATAAAAGPVALQSGTGGPGQVGALVLAYLVGVVGLDSESAVAWVRMVHPALLAADSDGPFAPSHGQRGGGLDLPAVLLSRSRSLPSPADSDTESGSGSCRRFFSGPGVFGRAAARVDYVSRASSSATSLLVRAGSW